MYDIKKENFKAWAVKAKDFPTGGTLQEKIKFLLNYGVLAPSTHNSQPWKFHVEGNTLTILPEEKRALPVGDPTHRLLFFSLGCALENIIIAAGHFGLAYKIDYGESIQVTFNGSDEIPQESERLFKAITKRCTNRANFTKQQLPNEFINWMEQLSNCDIKVEFVQDPKRTGELKKLIDESTPAVMSKPEFRKELAGLVRNNLTKKKTGMPAYVMGVPTLPSIFVPLILKLIDITKFEKKKLEGAENTTGFGVIAAVDDSRKALVSSGRLYERICLKSVLFNMYTHPLAAPVHDEVYRKKFAGILQYNLNPQFIFRLGFSQSVPIHSPRITPGECLA